jgi:glycine dehydrogenase
MGDEGLRKATQAALLNANYMMKKLEGAYKILYTNSNGMCAHEFIVDCRPFGATSGIEAIDIAKRLHVLLSYLVNCRITVSIARQCHSQLQTH